MNAIEVELQRLRQEVAQLRGQVQRLDGRPVSFSPKLTPAPGIKFFNRTDPAEVIPPYAAMVCRSESFVKGAVAAYKPGHERYRFYPGGAFILFNGPEEVAPYKTGTAQAGPMYTARLPIGQAGYYDPGSTWLTEQNYRWRFFRTIAGSWDVATYFYNGMPETSFVYTSVSEADSNNTDQTVRLISLMTPTRSSIVRSWHTTSFPVTDPNNRWPDDGPVYIQPFIKGFGPWEVNGQLGIKRPNWDMTEYAVTAQATVRVTFASTGASPAPGQYTTFKMQIESQSGGKSDAWGSVYDVYENSSQATHAINLTCVHSWSIPVGNYPLYNDTLRWSIVNNGGATLVNGQLVEIATESAGIQIVGVNEEGKFLPMYDSPVGPQQPGTLTQSVASPSWSANIVGLPEESLPGEGGTGEAPGGMEGPATPGPIEPL